MVSTASKDTIMMIFQQVRNIMTMESTFFEHLQKNLFKCPAQYLRGSTRTEAESSQSYKNYLVSTQLQSHYKGIVQDVRDVLVVE